jgi:hypothetical protein
MATGETFCSGKLTPDLPIKLWLMRLRDKYPLPIRQHDSTKGDYQPQDHQEIVIANLLHTDITKLHRQLRRLGRRVRQRSEEEAARDYRSVPEPRTPE